MGWLATTRLLDYQIPVKAYIAPKRPAIRWIWISAHSTKRRSSLGVMGDEEVPSVALANCLAARFALLAMVCVVRGLFWCVPWQTDPWTLSSLNFGSAFQYRIDLPSKVVVPSSRTQIAQYTRINEREGERDRDIYNIYILIYLFILLIYWLSFFFDLTLSIWIYMWIKYIYMSYLLYIYNPDRGHARRCCTFVCFMFYIYMCIIW